MNVFKKVSVLAIALILILNCLFMPGITHAADESSTSSSTSSTSTTTDSSTPATVQSDTYGDNGSTDGSTGGTPTDTTGTEPTTEPTTPAEKQNILTKAYLTDADGNIIDGEANPGDAIDPDEAINLNYDWALPNDGSYKSGSTFEFDLPSAFQLYNDINNVPLQFGDTTVGSFNATKSGHVTVTFNSTVEQYSNIHGTMQFRTSLSKETVSGSTEVKIAIPLGESSQFVVVYLKPDKGSNIAKRGEAINSSQIRWTIDLNTTKEKLENAVVTDPTGDGMKLDTVSVQVYGLNVNVDGTTTLGDPVTSGYTLSADESQFKLSFDQTIYSAYRIVYVTNMTDNARTVFSNTATLTSSKGDAQAQAQVTVQQQFLSKKVENYDEATGTIDWAIGYNLNNQTISQSNAIVKDRFNSSQQVVDGSLKVYDSQGNVLTLNQDYSVKTITPTNGRTGFDLQFLSDIHSSYTIKYQTRPVDQVVRNENISNIVTAGGVSVGVNQRVQGALFTKALTDANYIRKDATWKLTLNTKDQPLQGALIEDQFPNGGLEFLPNTLKITRADGSDYPSNLYTLTVNDARAGFRIDFKESVKEQLIIVYRTTFDADWKKNKSEVSYQNIGALYWLENGNYRTIAAEARFWPDNLTVNNGAKEGVYNPVTKEITWTIKANYNNKTLTNAILNDNLQAGQTYVEGSLGVYNMNVLGWWNGVSRGVAVDPSAYTATTPAVGTDGGALQVKFNNPINSAYWITFKTTLTGKVIPPTVRNDAVLKGDENSYPWAAVVSIPNGGEYVYKTGVQDNDKVNWTVQINRGQSYVENAKIIDQPTANQILMTDSFHLFSTVPAEDGTLTKSTEMVQGTDYKLTVLSGTPEKFELAFLKPISSAYILEYSTLINANDREKLSNNVQFSGNGITTGTVDTTKEIVVRTSSASGTGSGVVGNLIVHKVDASDDTVSLAGAVFTLQDAAGNRPAITKTTDSQGRILFTRLLYGKYNLQEIQAPNGYVADATIYPITISSANQQSGNVPLVTIKNTKQPTPETPGTPTTPETPPTPENPGTPPENPSNPSNPGTPSNPSNPGDDDDDTPNTPSNPEPTQPGGTTTPPATEQPVPVDDDPIPQGTTTPSQPEQPTDTGGTPDVSIPDEPVPQGTTPPDQTPTDKPSQSPDVPVPDEPIPTGTTQPKPTPQQQPMLPQTGESSSMPYWLSGAALIALGIFLNRMHNRKVKTSGRSD
ncbi:collagen binding domain-containing protein [Paenibacillus kandeliae]|uniref:collagen binding domain-containing protein n=1 Tax=Paenibacillus kandeliae TaxID=3231269 RepID=UPI00345AC144